MARQFLLAGGVVSVSVALIVGALVTMLIEAAVIRNSAATTAMYVDSVIAPLLPDLTTTDVLDDITSRILDETFGQGALGGRVLSFRLWRRDGTVLYATDKSLIGKQFGPSRELHDAFSGKMVAQFEVPDDEEAAGAQTAGNPVLQPWSGEVVAVFEFYDVAAGFRRTLSEARLLSWLAVGCAVALFFLCLSAIVFRGSRTIEIQKQSLTERIAELSDLLQKNRQLHRRAQRASQRATALNESYLRRLGADLHDGPAQLIAYAALRIDSRILVDAETTPAQRREELSGIKARLMEAMEEIRSICSGLVLPHIETAELHDVIRRAVDAHRQRTGAAVELSLSSAPTDLASSAKICIYRFVQEALNNGFRHGKGLGQKVRQHLRDNQIVVEVEDEGPGFDPRTASQDGLGLAGLRERIESLGGRFSVESSPEGTIACMSISAEGAEPAP